LSGLRKSIVEYLAVRTVHVKGSQHEIFGSGFFYTIEGCMGWTGYLGRGIFFKFGSDIRHFVFLTYVTITLTNGYRIAPITLTILPIK
jgi:hypothetical protein